MPQSAGVGPVGGRRPCGRMGGVVRCELEHWCAEHGLPQTSSAGFVSGWRSNMYVRGNVLFYQGNEPFALFFMCSGRVKLVRAEGGGRHKIVRIVKAPSFLGERSLIAQEPYAATAEVMDESHICLIDAARFLNFWTDRPELSRLLARQLAAKLGEAESQVADLALRTIRERLAKHLALEADAEKPGAPFELSESRQELAEILGTSPEVVSRTLADLAARKLIVIDGRIVRVLDDTRLRCAARIPARALELTRPLDLNQSSSLRMSSTSVAPVPHNDQRIPRRRMPEKRKTE